MPFQAGLRPICSVDMPVPPATDLSMDQLLRVLLGF